MYLSMDSPPGYVYMASPLGIYVWIHPLGIYVWPQMLTALDTALRSVSPGAINGTFLHSILVRTQLAGGI